MSPHRARPRLSRPGTWYLFDYGMVISTAPEPADWQVLAAALGLEDDDAAQLAQPGSRYWRRREEFDAGALSPDDFWSDALGRPATAEEVERLEALDAAQWGHLNPATAAVLDDLQGEGARLAVLSNMPAGMSRRYTAHASWAPRFDRLFFSGQLRMTKPDRRIFDHVAEELGAPAEDIVFIDDNEANIAAAQALGFRTVHHEPGTDLRAELAALAS